MVRKYSKRASDGGAGRPRSLVPSGANSLLPSARCRSFLQIEIHKPLSPQSFVEANPGYGYGVRNDSEALFFSPKYKLYDPDVRIPAHGRPLLEALPALTFKRRGKKKKKFREHRPRPVTAFLGTRPVNDARVW